MGPEALAQVLRPLKVRGDFPGLLSGLGEGDDAAVLRLDERTLLIQTVDYFTPIVDDPYLFGAISAANSMSDVFAMGGRVLVALNVVCFPHDMEAEVLTRILQGGADKVEEAGGVVAGGHTLSDDVPKYGLCVTGVADPERLVTKKGARPGDAVFLTKRIGTGVLATAAMGGKASERETEAAVESMLVLNRAASEAMIEAGATAATDVTGFGLAGHAMQIAERSRVRIALRLDAVPLLEGFERLVRKRITTGGARRNAAYYLDGEGGRLAASRPLTGLEKEILADPQTSGGLLVCIPNENAGRFLAGLAERGVGAWSIGEVEPGQGLRIQ